VAVSSSAEEVYGRCLGNATVLDAAARRFADAGDPVSALACAWSADVYATQAVLWERIMIAASSPQRQFFRVADALVTGMRVESREATVTSLAGVVESGRRALLAACEPALHEGLLASWADLGYLLAVPPPTTADLEEQAARRLAGRSVEAFVVQRRQEAAETMATAQALRIKGESVPAIQAAYDSDLSALEAYLVESADAVGDHHLLSVISRWELAIHALSTLPGLPEGFLAAVGRIRDAVAGSLGDADGTRLRRSLQPA
jgi:hypothetical protein